MFAVVLVGGFGTRLRPLTVDVPKPMLPVANRPMIVQLVERLAAGGVTDVVLALGFKPEPFRDAFPDDRQDGVRIHYAVEPEPLDTGGAIAFAARAVGVDDTFVVANGDIITDLSVDRLIDAHRAADAQATLHLIEVDDPSAFGVVELDPGGLVERFVEKPAPGTTDSRAISAGTYVVEPEVLDLIPVGQRCSVERDVFPIVAERRRLAGCLTDDYWIDTGRPEQYLRANLDAVDGRRPVVQQAVHDAADVDDDAVVGHSVLGAVTRVERGATVHDSVLLPGSVIGAGARVERSVVAGRVGADAEVIDAVLGSGAEVESRERLVGERRPAG